MFEGSTVVSNRTIALGVVVLVLVVIIAIVMGMRHMEYMDKYCSFPGDPSVSPTGPPV